MNTVQELDIRADVLQNLATETLENWLINKCFSINSTWLGFLVVHNIYSDARES